MCPESERRFDRLSDNCFLLEFSRLNAPNRNKGIARTTKRLEMRTINSPTDTRKAPETSSPNLVALPAWEDGSWIRQRNRAARVLMKREMRRTGIIIDPRL